MKINLLIADDRKEIADQIMRAIPWGEYDILPTTCYNGQDALKIVMQQGTDIVITDIEMPFLSGLELAEKCREENIPIKIIILSGYDNFSYARKALSLGVSEYLLKPVSMDDLLKTVLKAKEQLEQEQYAREVADRQHRREVRSLPMLRNELFKELLQGEISAKSFQEKAELAKLQIQPENVCLVLLAPHWSEQDKSKADSLRILNFGISNMAQEIFSRQAVCQVFHNGKGRLAVVFNYPQQQKNIVTEYNAYRSASDLQNAINEYYDIPVTIALSQCHTGKNSIKDAYEECIRLMGNGIYQDKNVILSQEDCKREASNHYPESLAEEILKAFSLHDLEKTLEKTNQLCQEIMKVQRLPPLELKNKLCNLLIRLGYSQGVETNIFDLSTEFLELSTMEEVQQWMCSHICRINSQSPTKQCTKDQIEAVQTYMEKNYDSPISLKEISESLYISQSYLSSLFKEQMGVNFTQYLTNLRMEKAKELLKNGHYKVYEIAEMVGYNDTRYFAELFRKHTGSLPKQWIKQEKDRSK